MWTCLRLLLLGLLLSACASKGLAPLTLEQKLARKGLQQGESIDRINRFVISGWQYIDDRHMLISGVGHNRYLLTFALICDEAAFAGEIGFSHTIGNSLTTMDKIVIKHAEPPATCPIRSIHKLEPLAKDNQKDS